MGLPRPLGVARKWSARADDVLSWLPARCTALLLMPLHAAAWRALPTEARRTPSLSTAPMAEALHIGTRAAWLGLGAATPAVGVRAA